MISSIDSLMRFLTPTPTSAEGVLTDCLAAADSAVKQYCGRDFELTTYPGAAIGGPGDSGFYSGENTRVLVLRQRPVISITAVYVDNAGYYGQGANDPFDPVTSILTVGTDYALMHDGYLNGAAVSKSGRLLRVNQVWPLVNSYQGLGGWVPSSWWSNTPGVLAHEVGSAIGGNIKVAYVAGYSAAVPGIMPYQLVTAVNQLAGFMYGSRKRGGYLLQTEQLKDYHYALAVLTGEPALGTTRQLLAGFRDRAF